MIQTKLYDLESQVRRGAAERGAVEVKNNAFQDEIQRRKEHMEEMESFYKKQLEGTQSTCTQEKVLTKSNECLKLSLIQTWGKTTIWTVLFFFQGTLQKNISSSAKTIQQLKGKESKGHFLLTGKVWKCCCLCFGCNCAVGQLSQLNNDLGKLQKELQSCQGNIKTLDKKLIYDM